MTIPLITLTDDTALPVIGLGTGGLKGGDGVAALGAALDSGYRLLDTALNYQNEREVGEAVRASSVARGDIVVSTKLPGRHHGYDETFASFEESRGNLGLDHVDLYLIHWPLPRQNRYVESWRAMIELRDRGVIGSIGVSNFTEEHLTRLVGETGVTPSVNQIELHPNFPQARMRAVHESLGIRTESWSPLGTRSVLGANPTVTRVAAAHSVTPTQAVLRWHLQLGSIPLPKSHDAGRQKENLDVFGFELSEVEMDAISGLESGRLAGLDPEIHEEF